MATDLETEVDLFTNHTLTIRLTFSTAFLVTSDAFAIICHVTEIRELLIASPKKETLGYLYQIEWIFPL